MNSANTVKRNAKPKPLIRSTGFTVVNRVNTPNTPINSTINVHIQPLSAEELRNVPEGQNTMQWVNMWSVEEIKNSDLIDTFTVQKTTHWEEGGFWVAQAVKVNN